jgi:hypothetical protein
MREIVTSAMTPVLTPEDELCLLLARGQLNPEERTRILQFLAIPLQWPCSWNALTVTRCIRCSIPA